MPNELFNEALIRRYDISAPRYTSYPTAPQFQPLSDQRYVDWATASNAGSNPSPLSLYVHIPFCSTVCYYCACTKIITNNRKHAVPYVRDLVQEISMQGRLFDHDRPVEQMHWGGGTPTFLNRAQMQRVMDSLDSSFNLCKTEASEYSIELDPREVTAADVGWLKQLGFNRLSLGVQDLDPLVQTAVNRIQPFETTLEILQAGRDQNYKSISVDLIYGLPKQTLTGFGDTLDAIIKIKPDRLSVFNYAHLPARFKVQKQIKQSDLPAQAEKLQILKMTIERLCDAGYVYIGMDHFARPRDELAIAQINGSLHRNFQGYSTHRDCDLIGLGMSSIGQINGNYVQNHPVMCDYEEAIGSGRLAVKRGFELNDDDKLRRNVIGELICHFKLDKASIESSHRICFNDYFKRELELLRPMAEDGLVDVDASEIRVMLPGRLLIRNICAVFDRYYNATKETVVFSKAI